MKYSEIYKEWRDNPIEFWKKKAEDVSWIKFPEKILTKKNENFYEWFSDGILNTCYNAVDKKLSLNRYMVFTGNAVAYKRYSKEYLDDEKWAKNNQLGMWQGKFIRPEEWRRKTK